MRERGRGEVGFAEPLEVAIEQPRFDRPARQLRSRVRLPIETAANLADELLTAQADYLPQFSSSSLNLAYKVAFSK